MAKFSNIITVHGAVQLNGDVRVTNLQGGVKVYQGFKLWLRDENNKVLSTLNLKTVSKQVADDLIASANKGTVVLTLNGELREEYWTTKIDKNGIKAGTLRSMTMLMVDSIQSVDTDDINHLQKREYSEPAL